MNKILTSFKRTNARVGGDNHISLDRFLMCVLFERTDMNWRGGTLYSGATPPLGPDEAIFDFSGRNIRFNDPDLGMPVELGYESADGWLPEFKDRLLSLAEDIFGRRKITAGAYFSPGTPLGKIPHTVGTYDLILCASLFGYLLNGTDRLACASSFNGSLSPFDPNEYWSALSFILMHRLEIDGDDIQNASSVILNEIYLLDSIT